MKENLRRKDRHWKMWDMMVLVVGVHDGLSMMVVSAQTRACSVMVGRMACLRFSAPQRRDCHRYSESKAFLIHARSSVEAIRLSRLSVKGKKTENERQNQGAATPELNHNPRVSAYKTLDIILMGYIVSLGTDCRSSRGPESETIVETADLRMFTDDAGYTM